MTIVERVVFLVVAILVLRFPPVALSVFLVVVVGELAYLLGYWAKAHNGQWIRWRIKNRSIVRKLSLILMVLSILTCFHPVSVLLVLMLVIWMGWLSPLNYEEVLAEL